MGEESLAADPRDVQAQYVVAFILDGRAKVLQGEEKLSAQHRAVELLEGVVAEFPDNPRHQLMMIAMQKDYARYLCSAGKPMQAERVLRRALIPAERISREFGDSPSYRMLYQSVLSDLAECLYECGNITEEDKIILLEDEEIRRLAATYPEDKGIATLHFLTEVAVFFEDESVRDIAPAESGIGTAIHLLSRFVVGNSKETDDTAAAAGE